MYQRVSSSTSRFDDRRHGEASSTVSYGKSYGVQVQKAVRYGTYDLLAAKGSAKYRMREGEVQRPVQSPLTRGNKIRSDTFSNNPPSMRCNDEFR